MLTACSVWRPLHNRFSIASHTRRRRCLVVWVCFSSALLRIRFFLDLSLCLHMYMRLIFSASLCVCGYSREWNARCSERVYISRAMPSLLSIFITCISITQTRLTELTPAISRSSLNSLLFFHCLNFLTVTTFSEAFEKITIGEAIRIYI